MTSAFTITTDDIVVTRARAGDLEALESVYRTFEAPIYSLARRLCRNSEDAEDVLQETFIEVMRSIHRFRGDGPLAGWIRKVAASKALMKLRRARTRGAEPLDEDGPDPGVPPAAGWLAGLSHDRIDLEAALQTLPDTARSVVWLHDVEGYTHEEIAEMMGKTPSFSKSQLARAHVRLRRSLTKKGEES
jgi:RNA polymerase sigma-70 factor (ECF subfamily)